jgi:putative nucleotidyltransferase with HDIG domain
VSWGDTPDGSGPTGTAIRTGVAKVTNNLATSAAHLPWIESARAHRLASSISLPIRADGTVIGALAVYGREPNAFGQPEVDLFEELAADIGYGIASRRTRVAYDAGLVQREQATRKLRAAFESLISVLAATVERRDPYTAGHQRRVAELASAIGHALGLDPARIEGLHFAATIHDIGKIYVPAEILARPGKLGATEFDMVKAHAQVGFEILEGVDFPWQVADMIRQHHERLDGSGYPQGLKGEQILLESRILAVADVIEAMSSNRPYREGLGIDAALAQIRREAGTRLDAQVVETCERVFREQGFAFSKD